MSPFSAIVPPTGSTKADSPPPLSHSLTLPLSHSLTLSLSHSLTLSLSHSPTLSLSHSLPLPHINPLAFSSRYLLMVLMDRSCGRVRMAWMPNWYNFCTIWDFSDRYLRAMVC